jgi:hypothetical protein
MGVRVCAAAPGDAMTASEDSPLRCVHNATHPAAPVANQQDMILGRGLRAITGICSAAWHHQNLWLGCLVKLRREACATSTGMAWNDII